MLDHDKRAPWVRLTQTPEKLPRDAKITKAADAYEYLKDRMRAEIREVAVVLCLGPEGHVLCAEEVARGNSHSVEATPCEVFRVATLVGATGIVFAHNHPNGNPKPSKQDRIMTTMLRETGKLLRIRFLGHIVVGHEGFTEVERFKRDELIAMDCYPPSEAVARLACVYDGKDLPDPLLPPKPGESKLGPAGMIVELCPDGLRMRAPTGEVMREVTREEAKSMRTAFKVALPEVFGEAMTIEDDDETPPKKEEMH